MIYGFMLDKNYRGHGIVKSSEDLMHEEFNNFSNIVKSIDCLTENGLLTEGIDFKAIGEKIKTTWQNFVTWFKEHIVKFFKELWQKIVNSKVGQAIAKLKSKKNPKTKDLEFKPGNTEAPAETTEKVEESMVSYLTEATKRELQLKIAIERSLVPELYFKLEEFVDVNKLSNAINGLIDHSRTVIKMVEDKNPKTDKQLYNYTSSKEFDEINAKGDQLVDEITSSIKFDISTNFNMSGMIEVVHNELKSRVPKSISYDSLVALVETNTKNATTEIKQLSNLIMTVDKFCDEFTAKLTTGISSKAVFDMINDAITSFRLTSVALSATLAEIKTMYQKATDIVANLTMLNEIL